MNCPGGRVIFAKTDYTKERQESLKNVTRAEFWQDIEEIRKETIG